MCDTRGDSKKQVDKEDTTKSPKSALSKSGMLAPSKKHQTSFPTNTSVKHRK